MQIRNVNQTRMMTDAFRGLDRRERIADGAWNDMENLTVEEYPAGMVRGRRQLGQTEAGTYPTIMTDIADAKETDDVLYLLDKDGQLYNYVKAGSGKEAWNRPLPVTSEELIDGESKVLHAGEQMAVLGRQLVFQGGQVIPDPYSGYEEAKLQNAYASITGECTVQAVELGERTYTVATTHIPRRPKDGDLVWSIPYKTLSQYDATNDAWGLITTLPNDFAYYDEEKQAMYVYDVNQDAFTPVVVSHLKLTFRSLTKSEGDFMSLFDGSQRNDCVSVRWPKPDSLAELLVWIAMGIGLDGFLSDYFVEQATFDEDTQKYEMYLRGLFIPAILNKTLTLKVTRRHPKMDHICQFKNRIWGCRYGENDREEFVNEIYASALGDPLNFFRMEVTAADSYVAPVGTGEEFTGMCAMEDYLLIFKEDRIYVVSGTEPANFRLREVTGPGVQAGSAKSAVMIGGACYYKSPHGVMRITPYNYPTCISDALGPDVWSDAIGGTDGRNYYISMVRDGVRELYQYHIALGMWTKEDDPAGLQTMLYANGDLLMIGSTQGESEDIRKRNGVISAEPDLTRMNSDEAKADPLRMMKINVSARLHFTPTEEEKFADNESLRMDRALSDVDGWPDEDFTAAGIPKAAFKILVQYYSPDAMYLRFRNVATALRLEYAGNGRDPEALVGMDGADYGEDGYALAPVTFAPEGDVTWFGVTGLRGLSDPDLKRVREVLVRVKMDAGALLRVHIMLDEDGQWIRILDRRQQKTGSFLIRYSPVRRCDVYRLKFEGEGKTVIYSITEATEYGGEN